MLPTGTVTFLLTDVEKSTLAWEADPDAMTLAMVQHNGIVLGAIQARGGVCPPAQGEGDSVVAAFERPVDAVRAALDAQRALNLAEWPTATPLRVRMAIHSGEARFVDGGNYAGPTIIRAARLRSIAYGSQVLVSQTTRDLVVAESDIELMDVGVHRLKDMSRPERVFQLAHAELTREFPPLVGLDTPQNLPLELSDFIGREPEIAEVDELLDQARLVTVTGAGGSGKTRLAAQIARARTNRHLDGVWWVELADLSEERELASVIAVAARLPGGSGLTGAAELAELLADRQVLLVLDNCEHLVGGVAELVDRVLRRCPGASVLATSRGSLDVDGELAWPIPALKLPPQRDRIDVDQAREFDAVRLFCERAARVRANFRLDDGNAGDVIDICHRLDGIPLAIELAAARCRSLDPARILDGLNDAFRVLKSGSRTALPRHQTLEASIAWSYNLLDAPEQTALRRLAVFSGGCTLEDAEAVVGTNSMEGLEVVDLLDRLVAQSLVRIDDNSGGTTRYRMLETVRQFGIRRAEEADEIDDITVAHAERFLAVARTLGPLAASADDVEAVAGLAASSDNILLAFGRLAELGRWDDVVSGIDTMKELLFYVRPARFIDLLDEVIKSVDVPDSPIQVSAELMATAYLSRALFQLVAGDLAGGVIDSQAVISSDLTGFARSYAHCVSGLGIGFVDATVGAAMLEQAAEELEESGFRFHAAQARLMQTLVVGVCVGHAGRARALLEQVRADVEKAQYGSLQTWADGVAAVVEATQGDYRAALQSAESAERRVRALAEASGTEFHDVWISSVFGVLAELGRTWARAATMGAEAPIAEIDELIASSAASGSSLFELAVGTMAETARFAAGDHAGVSPRWEALADRNEIAGNLVTTRSSLGQAAEASRRAGDRRKAEELLARSRALIDTTYLVAHDHLVAGWFALEDGDAETAQHNALDALRLALEHSLNWDLVCSLEQLVCVASERDLDELAAELAGAADARRREIGLVVDLFTDPKRLRNAVESAQGALGGERFQSRWEFGARSDLGELSERAKTQLQSAATSG